jgi:hypothetical protein
LILLLRSAQQVSGSGYVASLIFEEVLLFDRQVPLAEM